MRETLFWTAIIVGIALDSVPNNTPILRYDADGIQYFGFITEEGKCYTQIRVSDRELKWE